MDDLSGGGDPEVVLGCQELKPFQECGGGREVVFTAPGVVCHNVAVAASAWPLQSSGSMGLPKGGPERKALRAGQTGWNLLLFFLFYLGCCVCFAVNLESMTSVPVPCEIPQHGGAGAGAQATWHLGEQLSERSRRDGVEHWVGPLFLSAAALRLLHADEVSNQETSLPFLL